ncbi:MAG: hypothetical protein M0017_08110 [Desulfobacteraceae bacterium]|nr:hypothetical protein [Desulfobacteraceae bacterium]
MGRLLDNLRTAYYKIKFQYVLRNGSFGPGTVIRCRLEVKGPGRFRIGAGCRLEPGLFGDEHVTIYTHHPRALVAIGDNVTLRATRFGSSLRITVEDDAVLEAASIYDSDFHHLKAEMRNEANYEGDRQVLIARGCYIGLESQCAKGASLGEGAILLPAAIIGTKAVPAGAMVGGNPAMLMAGPRI